MRLLSESQSLERVSELGSTEKVTKMEQFHCKWALLNSFPSEGEASAGLLSSQCFGGCGKVSGGYYGVQSLCGGPSEDLGEKNLISAFSALEISNLIA